MYAIPAETASQNMPFEKENLPGPGEQSVTFSLSISPLITLKLQMRFRRRPESVTVSSCSFANMTTASQHTCGQALGDSGIL